MWNTSSCSLKEVAVELDYKKGSVWESWWVSFPILKWTFCWWRSNLLLYATSQGYSMIWFNPFIWRNNENQTSKIRRFDRIVNLNLKIFRSKKPFLLLSFEAHLREIQNLFLWLPQKVRKNINNTTVINSSTRITPPFARPAHRRNKRL